MSLTTFEKVSLGFCFIFPLVYTRGPSCVVYYTKFTLYYISLTFISTICLPLTLFRPRDTRNLLWPGRFLKCTTQFLGLQWKNHHQEEKEDIITKSKKSLITPGPAVVVINHQSSLDVLGLVTEIWPLLEGKYVCSFLKVQLQAYFMYGTKISLNYYRPMYSSLQEVIVICWAFWFNGLHVWSYIH